MTLKIFQQLYDSLFFKVLLFANILVTGFYLFVAPFLNIDALHTKSKMSDWILIAVFSYSCLYFIDLYCKKRNLYKGNVLLYIVLTGILIQFIYAIMQTVP